MYAHPITRNSPIIKEKALGRHPTNEDALPRVIGVVAKGQQIYVQKDSAIKSLRPIRLDDSGITTKS